MEIAISLLSKVPPDSSLCYLKRPRYAELKTVMEQVPEIQKDSLEQFDSKLLNVTLQKVADKRRKDHFKRLIAGCIGVRHDVKQQRYLISQDKHVFLPLCGTLINVRAYLFSPLVVTHVTQILNCDGRNIGYLWRSNHVAFIIL